MSFFSIRENITSGAASFFGVPPKYDAAEESYQARGNYETLLSSKIIVSLQSVSDKTMEELHRDKKWTDRRMRHCSRRYGGIKEVPPEQRCQFDPSAAWGMVQDHVFHDIITPAGEEFTDRTLSGQQPMPSSARSIDVDSA